MEIDDLMESQKDRVKLHNPSRNAIRPSGEGQGHRLRHYALVALEGGSRGPSIVGLIGEYGG